MLKLPGEWCRVAYTIFCIIIESWQDYSELRPTYSDLLSYCLIHIVTLVQNMDLNSRYVSYIDYLCITVQFMNQSTLAKSCVRERRVCGFRSLQIHLT